MTVSQIHPLWLWKIQQQRILQPNKQMRVKCKVTLAHRCVLIHLRALDDLPGTVQSTCRKLSSGVSVLLFRGVNLRQLNPPQFAGLSSCQTKFSPKNLEEVVWEQSKGWSLTKHHWKPLYRQLVWPYLRYFLSYLRDWGKSGTWVVGGNIGLCSLLLLFQNGISTNFEFLLL